MYYDVTPLVRSGRTTYTYVGPAGLTPGRVVWIPLGRRRQLGVIRGAATALSEALELEPTPTQLTPAQYELALWIGQEYLTHPGMTLRQMVPESVVRAGMVTRAVSTPARRALNNSLVICRDLPLLVTEQIATCRGRGQSVLILVPDRRQLTPVAEAVSADETFASGGRVAERNQLWQRVASGKPLVLVGTRGALHLPWSSIGLVIVTEEDEMAYKQDQAPRYHARPVASRLASLTGADLVLTSLAPSLEAFHATTNRKEEILQTNVSVVEPVNSGVPYSLWEAVDREAGAVLLHAPARMVEAVARQVTKAFPDRTVVTERAPRARQIAVVSHAALWLPGHYGVVACFGFDTLAQLPDFRASEKALATLRKLAARTADGGRLVVVTTEASHIASYVTKPYDAFATNELAERRTLQLPPWQRLTRIVFTAPTAEGAAGQAAAALARLAPAGLTLTNGPCPIPETAGQYRWQVVATGDPKTLAPYLAAGWRVDVDPLNLL